MNTFDREIEYIKAKNEAINCILEEIKRRITNGCREWGKVGEKQDYEFENGKKILLWEDEEKTIPKMIADYDYIEKEELTEEEQVQKEAYEDLADEIITMYFGKRGKK